MVGHLEHYLIYANTFVPSLLIQSRDLRRVLQHVSLPIPSWFALQHGSTPAASSQTNEHVGGCAAAAGDNASHASPRQSAARYMRNRATN
jgi:hypothetical protein